MAAGQLLHFAESVFSLRFADFASALQNPLSVDAWGRLRQEWSKAAAFVWEKVKIRLGFYQSLPWIILGGRGCPKYAACHGPGVVLPRPPPG